MELIWGYSPMHNSTTINPVDWSWDSVDEDVRKLSEDTTELGIAAEETFKNAVAALYTTGFDAVTVVEAAIGASDAHIHAAIGDILRRPTLSGDAFRRIGEIQSIANAFVAICDHARAIAGHALALRGGAETELGLIAPDVDALLQHLIRQAFIVIRGSVVVSSSRDQEMAARVVGATGDLDRLYLDFRRADLAAISAYTEHAVLLQTILLTGTRLQGIGDCARAVCKAISRN